MCVNIQPKTQIRQIKGSRRIFTQRLLFIILYPLAVCEVVFRCKSAKQVSLASSIYGVALMPILKKCPLRNIRGVIRQIGAMW
jgi:hypothetical protein